VTGTSKSAAASPASSAPPLRRLRESHGTHEYFRHGGSIGTNMTPGRTMPGKKMPGQHGNTALDHAEPQASSKVIADQNLVLIEGAVPGADEGIVTVRGAVKTKKKKA
jgi:large subunit ribosomal protein L3